MSSGEEILRVENAANGKNRIDFQLKIASIFFVMQPDAVHRVISFASLFPFRSVFSFLSFFAHVWSMNDVKLLSKTNFAEIRSGRTVVKLINNGNGKKITAHS